MHDVTQRYRTVILSADQIWYRKIYAVPAAQYLANLQRKVCKAQLILYP